MSDLSGYKTGLREALQECLHVFARDDSDRGLVVHFSVVMEVVGGNGGTWLKHVSSEGISAWTELGMLISAADDVRETMRSSTVDLSGDE